jgi:predicted SAM-dependent methyltransferase
MKLLNLGCGKRFHQDWINLDFTSTHPDVIAHNLLNGLPYEDESIDVVYHSHVLEHFSKSDGEKFISECYRVLKKGGIIRIALPDLEIIAREYLNNLERSLNLEYEAEFDYDWIILEMYDQTVRNYSGGEMAKYLFQEIIPNETYVFSRIGQEGKAIRDDFFLQKNKVSGGYKANKKSHHVTKFSDRVKSFLKRKLFSKEILQYQKFQNEINLGKFRMGGEVHQWMYDRYSLSKLLSKTGFDKIEKKTAFQSDIKNWESYGLESKNGDVFKPDSLFMEALK